MGFRKGHDITRFLPWWVGLVIMLIVGIHTNHIPTTSASQDLSDYPVDIASKQSSSCIALTPDGSTLLVVNPDSNSLSLVDTATRSLLAEIPVGLEPRTVAVDDAGNRAYVANRGSDSFSVIDLASTQVITQVRTGRQPYGLLVSPNGGCLYVAEQGASRLSAWDTTTFQRAALYTVPDRPSGMALSSDGHSLYLTHLFTNTITIITFQPFSAYLPLLYRLPITGVSLPTGGLLGKASPSTPIVPSIHCSGSAALDAISLWPDSNLVQSIVISPNGDLAVVPHTRANTGNRALTFDSTVFPVLSLIDLPTRQHLVGQQYDLGAFDPPGVGLPFDAAFSPDGSQLWVLNAASNDLTVIDLLSRQRLAHIEVSDNPRGILISPDGSLVYVNNTLAGSLSVIDTAAFTVTALIPVTELPLPPTLLNGKRLFFSSDDPRMSRSQWVSCNTCHYEGEQDGRTWFFGFAGPRNTTSLGGMIETYPLRWSGEWDESADAEFANRKENFGAGLLSGDMNCSLDPPDCVHSPPNQGRSYDLDSLAAYLDSLAALLSPNHAYGEPLSPSELRGQGLFNDPTLGCVTCHPPPLYTDLTPHDVGTATPDERIGPAFDTPSLRGLYASAPYFHDGSAFSLLDALTRPSPDSEHDLSDILSIAQFQDLIAFLFALPYPP